MIPTPTQKAKQKVWQLFFAMSAPKDLHWHEVLRGGYEASFSSPSGVISAFVSEDGYYEVYAGKRSAEKMICLMAGSFSDQHADGASADTMAKNKNFACENKPEP